MLILALPLAVLFHSGFQSELALFSNDGPLGVISSQAASLPGTFFGYWDDLNWVGREKPSSAPNFSQLLGGLVGTVVYSKIGAPLSLLLLGFAGWLLFRQLGFQSTVCVLGAIAFALNMNGFSNACWGLSSWTVARASALLALVALHLQPARMPFLKYILAGFSVGHGITEGFDLGALYSLAIGAYAAFLVFMEKGDAGQKGLKAAGLVLAVAVSAAVFSTQILATLIGTQIQGVAGMGQTKEAKEKRWDEATQWSLPVKEALRVGVPGLFGYRMTDLEGRPSASSYWGAVGRTPGWETHRQGSPRHSGSGEYAGALVLAMAAFAVFQSFRRRSRTPLDRRQRLAVWFWAGIALVSILLAFGRHAPFYRLPYELLPYFSTIRNPIKFMHLFHLAATILFGYGLQVLWTYYLKRPPAREKKLGKLLKQWWAKALGFDRKWTLAGAGVIAFGLLSCLIYASAGKEMAQLLSESGFSEELAREIHKFSVFELLWSIAFFSIIWILVTPTLSGIFHWKHRKALGIAMGLLLVADLGRADRFWIVYYDYKKKYTSNPVIDKLRGNAFERRVALRLNPFGGGLLSDASPKGNIFHNMAASWLQHQFPYYNISSLDIIQMPRIKEEDKAFMEQFTPQPRRPELNKYARLWELTSTRYLLGMTNYLAVLNQQLDPGRERFQILSRFDFLLKESAIPNAVKLEDVAVVEHPLGPFGIIEFTGALPKAKRYPNWIVRTNQQAALNKLAEPQFDPLKTVVVMNKGVKPPAEASEENDGTATIESYHPKAIRIQTAGSSDGVLLYNDRYHPHWKVYVNGERRPLLRCNSIMRGVEVPAGSHVVEFRYKPPQWGLAISLSSIALGLWIGCLCLAGGKRKSPPSAASDG